MALRTVLLVFVLTGCGDLARAQLTPWHEVDGRTRGQRVRDPRPLDLQPYLGLYLGDAPDEGGATLCRARLMWQPGPLLLSDSIRRGDYILALNDVAIHSAQQFGQVLEGLAPGSDARLKVRPDPSMWPSKPKGTEEVVSVRGASRADWATPLDIIRPSTQRVKPDELTAPGAGKTKFEQFVSRHLNKFRILHPVDDLRNYLVEIVERFYGANMLDRVAYAFYRPTRLAELQASSASPLARIVDQNKANPWAVAGPILAEAATNLDTSFAAGKPGQIVLAHPAQALNDASGMVHRAYAQLERAFANIGAEQLAEMETSLPALLDDSTKRLPSAMRARMASTSVDYAGLFAAAEAIASWSAAGEPPAGRLPAVAVPRELEGAVKGEVLAIERIEGRWYVYGGPGPNEYDLSRIDVVIDPGGNDRYHYSSLARPRVQIVVDWAGNDVYFSEGEIPGPASAMLGVSVLVDHQGDDRCEGALRSCGAGLMGIGLILDHAGNDTYKGPK